ncbi:MAG: CpsB/CapC family capsule biosynthesis tyrosine phosphatase [Pseudomonadota bacterium]
MIDIHCHILPGLDDGARSPEEGLVMAKMAVKDGIHTLIATPHTLNGVYLNSADKVGRDVKRFQAELSRRGIPLKCLPGSDIHLCPGLNRRIKDGDAATMNNKGKHILLEFPPQIIPERIKDEIFSLKLGGITPIITHPERHPLIGRHPEFLFELVSMGALCQITAMSITGDFGEPARYAAERMLEGRMVHIIATDAHSSDTRPPLLSSAVEAAADILCSYEEAERMVTEVPAAIISGKNVDIDKPRKG